MVWLGLKKDSDTESRKLYNITQATELFEYDLKVQMDVV